MIADIDITRTVVTTAVTSLVLTGLALWTLRSPKLERGELVLQLSTPMRWIVRFAIAGMVGLLVAGTVQVWIGTDPKTERAMWFGVPVLLALIVAAARELRVRLVFDEHGVRGQTAWRGEREIAWNDVVSARWSGVGYWLRLDAGDGEVLRISGWLQGTEHLIAVLEAKAPPCAGPSIAKAIAGWRRRPG